MSDPFSKRDMWLIAAVISAFAGIGLAILAVVTVDDYSRRIREYTGYAAKLQDLAKAADSSAAALKTFDSLSTNRPVPLAELLRESLPGEKPGIAEQPPQITVPGWTLRRMEVTMTDVPLSKLGDFLTKAEAQRPPWRMVLCWIRATSQQGGTGQVLLTLEALERTQ